jgi:Ca2+-binding RTX toxin-like protein
MSSITRAYNQPFDSSIFETEQNNIDPLIPVQNYPIAPQTETELDPDLPNALDDSGASPASLIIRQDDNLQDDFDQFAVNPNQEAGLEGIQEKIKDKAKTNQNALSSVTVTQSNAVSAEPTTAALPLAPEVAIYAPEANIDPNMPNALFDTGAGGGTWGNPPGPTQITFSFKGGAEAMNDDQMAWTIEAILTWEAVANIGIAYDPSGDGQISFGTKDLGANLSGQQEGSIGDKVDVWLNNNVTATTTQPSLLNPTLGSVGFQTLIHELGHALGLKHPGNYSGVNGTEPPPYLNQMNDSWKNTVMSYNGTNGNGTTFLGTRVAPETPMLYDMIAIGNLYGPNFNYRTGNDVYSWASNDAVFATIWDMGGIDSIDASNQLQGVEIDLNPGSFSSIGPRRDNDPTAAGLNLGIGFSYIGDSYAYSWIENAIGSNFKDTLEGNILSNRLTGNDGDDYLYGYSNEITDYTFSDGKDTLIGGAGVDTLRGGTDNDALVGGADADDLDGGAGDDVLIGDEILLPVTGDDTLFGNSGNDSLFGGNGKDKVYGGANDDLLYGESGKDTLDGGSGSDTLYGGDDGDTLSGGSSQVNPDGSNLLYGEGGDDSLVGGLGASDTLYGGAGNDTLQPGIGSALLDGGEGIDTANYSNNITTGVSLNLITGIASGRFWTDKLIGIETVLGSDLNDTLIGGSGDNTLDGRSGIDFLNGGSGSDSLYGGAGKDTLVGGDQDDSLYGEDGDDYLGGGTGNDVLFGDFLYNLFAGNDTLGGDTGNDTLFAWGGNDSLDGGGQDDFLYDGSGNDVVNGGDGDDRFFSGAGDNSFFGGGTGNDTLNGGNGIDQLHVSGSYGGFDLRDTWLKHFDSSNQLIETDTLSDIETVSLVGNERDNGINAYFFTKGSVSLSGQGGTDKLYGGSGNDTLDGGTGNDALLGGKGNDTLSGQIGSDLLTGMEGNDVLIGGDAANDAFSFGGTTDFSTAALGIDRIIDFGNGPDSIVLSKTVFSALKSQGGIGFTVSGFSVASEFAVVATDAAVATSQAIIAYSKGTGNLFYNQNGSASGLGAGGQFATLMKAPELVATDFIIQA